MDNDIEVKLDIKDLNLYQRLSGVRKTLSFIKTEKQTSDAKYATTKSSLVLYPLHKPINDYGLLLIPEIISEDPVVEIKSSSGGVRYLVKLNMTMTWVNIDKPDEKHTVKWIAKGLNSDPDKAVGAALTYSERYFMLKFFNIATDKDDPDTREDEPDLNNNNAHNHTESFNNSNQMPKRKGIPSWIYTRYDDCSDSARLELSISNLAKNDKYKDLCATSTYNDVLKDYRAKFSKSVADEAIKDLGI